MPNRLLFNDRLDTIIREANRTGECFAVLFVDLDRFKFINDTLGHAVGDQVLVAVTQRLRSSVRASDTVARYAGDEFTIVLRHIVKTDDVLRVAEKIVQLMDVPLHLDDGPELQVTASIGISFSPKTRRMRKRSSNTRTRRCTQPRAWVATTIAVYDVSPAQEQQNAALKARLRHAGGQRRACASSINRRFTRRPRTLLAWRRCCVGSILSSATSGPGFSFPSGRRNGAYCLDWRMGTAHGMQTSQSLGDRFGLRLRLGVNLFCRAIDAAGPFTGGGDRAGRNRSRARTVGTGSDRKHQHQSGPQSHGEYAEAASPGLPYRIDDFGTGAASLDYLRKLPADRIKIDQSFVRNIGVDPDDEAIVRATIEMAHRLKRGVVAEGVEIEQHLQFLRANHCDELQGYLFCRPLPQGSFERLLSERERLLSGVQDKLPA